MTLRNCLLFTYRALLWLYPPEFRQRFAPEMAQLVEASEPAEWPLMFGDTALAVVRCWFSGTRSVALAENNPYVPVGSARISASVLIPGLVLSLITLAGWSYVENRWPPPCPDTIQIVTRVADPAPALVHGSANRVHPALSH